MYSPKRVRTLQRVQLELDDARWAYLDLLAGDADGSLVVTSDDRTRLSQAIETLEAELLNITS